MASRGLTVASWNLRGPARGHSEVDSRQRAALVRRLGVDVLLVQHAQSRELQRFAEQAGLDWAVSADDLQVVSGRGRLLPGGSAAVLGRGAKPRSVRVFTDVPDSTGIVVAELETSLGPVTVAAYDGTSLLLGRSHELEQLRAFARWLEGVDGTAVVATSVRTPEVDHPDRGRVRTRRPTGERGLQTREPGEDLMFGPNPIHELDDALRRWLDEHPDQLERIRQTRPSGPLAVSYMYDDLAGSRRRPRRRSAISRARRYDALWVTADVRVNTIYYHYLDALQLGCEHALVVAHLDRGTVGPTKGPDMAPDDHDSADGPTTPGGRRPASSEPTSSQHQPRAGDENGASNDRLAQESGYRPADLDTAPVPEESAAYAWWDGQEPVYVAATEALADQLRNRDLQGQQTPVAPFRKVVRQRMAAEGVFPYGAPLSERSAAIDRFIHDRLTVNWVETHTVDEARELARVTEDNADLVEPGRPLEDRLLHTYLNGLPSRRAVFTEVPIGGGPHPRRIDAVRFPDLPADTEADVHDGLATGAVELIEVKRDLNRSVFGQALIARELAVTDWGLAPSTRLTVVVIVARTDPTLEPIFTRYGIRIVHLTRPGT